MGEKRESNDSSTFFHPDLLEIPADGTKPYLKGYRCKKCGQLDFPKMSPCPNCWHDQFDIVPLSRAGKLYAVTHISVGQAGLPAPYAFGYIDLPENLRIFAQVEGEPDSLRCDDEMEMFIGTIRTNSDGLPVRSYKFRRAGRSTRKVK